MSELAAADSVDVVFALRGEAIDPDYSLALRRAVCALLPWMDELAGAGIHPLKGAMASGDRLVLSRRAHLALRLPRARAADASALSGATLNLGGVVEVGAANVRELSPYPALHSHFVEVGCDAEEQFVAEARRLVTAAGIEGKLIVGKHHFAGAGATRVSGYSLMLHGLSAEHSLRLQSSGLGANRLLGCGIFVPHKSIAAVGL